ncbi:hypothetical protein GcC1_140013 [Golovinomyces cichoracearum]|uniref:Uncharacterized protein n=1 Tax=Golovinomyces cichoracearum TaxID=62708 RepID=A0A420I0N9_9PEZI|nr:hypothetical protein GcC1_140013 [Golovinomyces cichoracearum]
MQHEPISKYEGDDDKIALLRNQINKLGAEVIRKPHLMEQCVIIEKDLAPIQQSKFQSTELSS